VAVAAIEALDAQARTGYWGDSITGYWGDSI
jgi:hypothetical protein